MRTVEMIDREIQALSKKLNEVRGKPTEVYTRIVGYYRNIENWNKGKREEYNFRKTYKVDKNNIESKISESKFLKTEKKSEDVYFVDCNLSINKEDIASYILFTSQFCRNCPPVKSFMSKLSLPGEEIDVSNEIGASIASKYDIMSTPTVVFFDKEQNVISKAHNVSELKAIFLDEKEKILV